MATLDDDSYARLLALRTGLRRFERWSAQQAEAAGLTPAQHQLLLAIRGHGDPPGPTIGEAADYLLLQHHSTVGLADRAEGLGLVYRTRDDADRRVVRLHLTPAGSESLAALSALHLEELDRLALDRPEAWKGLAPARRHHGFPVAAEPTVPRPEHIEVARVYEPRDRTTGRHRVLVDRLWPRGISKADPPFDDWMKEVAPSPELRTWYGHAEERFPEFDRRYRQELQRPDGQRALRQLHAAAKEGPLVLMTATKAAERSGAAVLAAVLRED